MIETTITNLMVGPFKLESVIYYIWDNQVGEGAECHSLNRVWYLQVLVVPNFEYLSYINVSS